jgi:hypothetical protein
MTAKRTATDRVSASSPAIEINNRDRHGLHVLQGAPLVGITTKPPPVTKTELTRQQRDAIDAFGRSVITVEQAFPQPADTATSQERSSGRGWRIADAWSTHAAAFLRNVIDNAAKPLSRRDGAKPRTAAVAHQPAQQPSVWQRVSIGVGLPSAPGRQATRGREDSFADHQTAGRGSYER